MSIEDILEAEDLKYKGKIKYIWKGRGYCKARNIRKENDYCNNKTKSVNRAFCPSCECSVHGCHKKWTTWNLYYGKFCSSHKYRIPDK